MTPKESLIAARALIQDEKNWIQRSYYSDADGNNDCIFEEATCFCTVGALFRVNKREISGDDHKLPGARYLQRAARQILGTDNDSMQVVFDYNDTLNHPDVLDLFDRAIALCK